MAISEYLRVTAEAMGVEPVTRQDLFRRIQAAYDLEHPVHQATDFVNTATPFRVGSIEGGRMVYPPIADEQVTERIDAACRILTALQARKPDGKPFFSPEEAMHAFSIMLPLIPHGCLGSDGHGRLWVRLLPLTLNLAGYGHFCHESNFTDAKGNFSIKTSMVSMALMYGWLGAGIRNVAEFLQIKDMGDTEEMFQDSWTVWRQEGRKNITRHAISCVWRMRKKLFD